VVAGETGNGVAPRVSESHPDRRAAAWGTATCVLALMVLILIGWNWTHWPEVLLVVVPALAGWWLRRRSLLVSLYLAQVSLYFGLFPLFSDEPRSPLLVPIVLLWTLGVVVGALVGGADTRQQHQTRLESPGWWHFILVMALMASQVMLIASGQLGLGAQITTGLSTPTGLFGTLATITPFLTVMLVISALGARRRVSTALLLAIVEAVILPLSGFRGATPTFLIMVLVSAALTLPKDSPWRRPERVAAVCIILALLGIAAFRLGSEARNSTAIQLGQSSAGKWLVGPAQALPMIAERLDHATYLDSAITMRDDATVADAVSWKLQLQGFVPRFVWPTKPTVDYGQRVSVAVYGIRDGNNSATITAIGDTLINFKVPGLVFGSILVGLMLGLGERWVRAGSRPLTLAVSIALISFILSQEAAPIRIAVGLVQDLLVATVLWYTCQALARLAGYGGTAANRPAEAGTVA
jgi:hypothetical protein